MAITHDLETVVTSIQSQSIPEVYTALHTRPQGLTQAEAQARLKQFGPNTILEVQHTSLLVKLLANFTHLMALLLWAGGIIAPR